MSDRSAQAFVRLSNGTRLEHFPALDGLRGLAVLIVMLYHGHWSWALGGFISLPLFFSLSGFLITSLLIAESDTERFVDMGDFWRRRFRRLLPASWLTLGLIVIVASALSSFTAADRGDALAAFFNVANWRFLASGNSYNDLFSDPGPTRHFWSLAVEEQAYFVVPLVVAVTLKLARGSRRVLAAVLASLTLLSLISTLVASSTDRIYYGTDTRAAEILLGALLAVVVTHRPFRVAVVRDATARMILSVVSTAALVVFAVGCVVLSFESAFIPNGGLVVAGGLSSLLIFAAITGVGPVAAIGSLRPLRWLGRISYGVYLFHWPLLVFLTERRTGLSHAPRFILAISITLILAELSYRFFEMPLRRGIGNRQRSRQVTLAAVAALLMVLVLAPTVEPKGFDADRAAAGLEGLADTIPPATDSAPAAPDAPEGPVIEQRPPTLMTFGDSVALSFTMPIIDWGKATGDWIFVGGNIELGCGIGRRGQERSTFTAARREICNAWPLTWTAATDVEGLDIAMVHTGQWDIVDRKLEGDTVWRTVGDPVYDEFLLGEFAAVQDVLARNGALVMWVNLPYYSRLDEDTLPANIAASHAPERVDRLNQLIEQHVAKYPDSARMIDLASWMDDKVDDISLRADGTHFNETGVERIVSEFFRPQILDTWNGWRTDMAQRGGA